MYKVKDKVRWREEEGIILFLDPEIEKLEALTREQEIPHHLWVG